MRNLTQNDAARISAQHAIGSWSDVPPLLRDRLSRNGINSVTDWRALGRKRHLVFGVTSKMVRQLDALARRRGEKAHE